MSNLPETLEPYLLTACTAPDALNNPCTYAAQAHFSAGGARIRAHFCLDAAHRLALSPEDALHLAAACELLHNASLVQDDLLDRTEMRRGKPSIWLAFGETVAICLSDLMLAGAYASLGQLTSVSEIPAVVALVHQRTRDVILGQAVETLDDASLPSALALYERRARGKSAPLLSLPLELPLLVSGNAAAMPQAKEAAGAFAVAYQISDDLEDLEQDEAQGSCNVVLMLERGQKMSRAQARSAAAARGLQLLRQSKDCAAKLPCACARAMEASSQKLAGKLAAFESASLARADN
jgi:geranylgeranyl pyrophosphate synthase